MKLIKLLNKINKLINQNKFNKLEDQNEKEVYSFLTTRSRLRTRFFFQYAFRWNLSLPKENVDQDYT